MPFKNTGLDYFGPLYARCEEMKERKKFGLLIHLCCCEGCPLGNCWRSYSGGISYGITKIYCKMRKT